MSGAIPLLPPYAIMARTGTTLPFCHLGFKVNRVCPAIKMKLSVEPRWNRTDLRKTHVLVENPVPVPLCLPQILNEVFWARTLSAAFSNFPLNRI